MQPAIQAQDKNMANWTSAFFRHHLPAILFGLCFLSVISQRFTNCPFNWVPSTNDQSHSFWVNFYPFQLLETDIFWSYSQILMSYSTLNCNSSSRCIHVLVLKNRLDPLLGKEVRSHWVCTVSDRVGICTQDLLTQKPVLLKTPQPCVFFLHPQHNHEVPTLPGRTSLHKLVAEATNLGETQGTRPLSEVCFHHCIWNMRKNSKYLFNSFWLNKRHVPFLPFHRVPATG